MPMAAALTAFLDRQIARIRRAIATGYHDTGRTASPMTYLMCHDPECRRGYRPEQWTPKPGVAAVDADPETTPLRHRQCPRGHQFTDPESWQTEEQYRQDREHERLMASQAEHAARVTPSSASATTPASP